MVMKTMMMYLYPQLLCSVPWHMFKICHANICPKMGNRSLLNCQDLIIHSNLSINSEGLIEKIPSPTPIPVQIQYPVSMSSQPESTTISDQGLFDALVDIRKSYAEFKMSIKNLATEIKKLTALMIVKTKATQLDPIDPASSAVKSSTTKYGDDDATKEALKYDVSLDTLFGD